MINTNYIIKYFIFLIVKLKLFLLKLKRKLCSESQRINLSHVNFSCKNSYWYCIILTNKKLSIHSLNRTNISGTNLIQ